MPTQLKNIIWRQIVNIPNVIKALQWLKTNNIHYKDIIVDENIDTSIINSEFLEETTEAIEIQNNIEENSLKEHRDVDYDIESHFTIHELKSNDDQNAIEKYSMKHVDSNIINEKDKNLDHLCFPILFPYGKGKIKYFKKAKLHLINKKEALMMIVKK